MAASGGQYPQLIAPRPAQGDLRHGTDIDLRIVRRALEAPQRGRIGLRQHGDVVPGRFAPDGQLAHQQRGSDQARGQRRRPPAQSWFGRRTRDAALNPRPATGVGRNRQQLQGQRQQSILPAMPGRKCRRQRCTQLFKARARTVTQEAERVSGTDPIEQFRAVVVHDSMQVLRFCRPRRTQLLTVPRGWPSRSAMRSCVRPLW